MLIPFYYQPTLSFFFFLISYLYSVANLYSSPYGKCVHDTLSYIVLVVLHYALCLSPSTIAFSRLEWVILVFFVGRYLIERQQIRYIMQRIKQRRNQSKWIRLKTLSAYLRYVVFTAIYTLISLLDI